MVFFGLFMGVATAYAQYVSIMVDSSTFDSANSSYLKDYCCSTYVNGSCVSPYDAKRWQINLKSVPGKPASIVLLSCSKQSEFQDALNMIEFNKCAMRNFLEHETCDKWPNGVVRCTKEYKQVCMYSSVYCTADTDTGNTKDCYISEYPQQGLEHD